MEPVVKLFKIIQFALLVHGITGIYLKPKQVICFEEILSGNDVLAVLPTRFGKSLLYHLLPSMIPTKSKRNIVIVVCPLSKVLLERGISVGILQCEKQKYSIQKLFPESYSATSGTDDNAISTKIKNGEIDILFSHPETFLSSEGRKCFKVTNFSRQCCCMCCRRSTLCSNVVSKNLAIYTACKSDHFSLHYFFLFAV